MSKAALLSLAAGLALAGGAALQAQAPSRQYTQDELMKTLDKLGTGDPLTKLPLSAEPEPDLPKRDPAPSKSDPAKPKKPKPKLDANGQPLPPGETVITSEEGSFDQHTHRAIFLRKVFVKNPDFTLSCDKLTAFMKHDDAKPDAPAGTGTKNRRPPATPAAAPTATPPGRLSVPSVTSDGTPVTLPADKAPADAKNNGLDKAIAEGSVEIIQDKVDENGNVSRNVGHSQKAVYDSITGDVTLTGKPEVQQGINSVIAQAEETIIILNRDGHMKTIGPTKTFIRENSPGAAATPKK